MKRPDSVSLGQGRKYGLEKDLGPRSKSTEDGLEKGLGPRSKSTEDGLMLGVVAGWRTKCPSLLS